MSRFKRLDGFYLLSLKYGATPETPDDVRKWILEQDEGVVILWLEAWETDRTGDRFVPLPTSLSGTELWGSLQILSRAQLFEFEPVFSPIQKNAIAYWTVKNLRGSTTRRKAPYQEFLNSDYWQGVRQQVLARDRHTCQHCGATQNLNVHHLTYEHHGEEHLHLDDLLTLCRSCHAKEHGLDS